MDRHKHHHHKNQHHHHTHHKHHKPDSLPATSSSQSAHSSSQPSIPAPYRKNFKLLIDPVLIKGAKKLYRIEGSVHGDNTWSVHALKDPRSALTRIWARLEAFELPVPKFKIDENYVGQPPGVEVGITNLNDNITQNFLTELISKFGETEEIVIYYHPVSHKHLGVARVVFIETDDAAACVRALKSRPVMGKKLVVFLDPFGKKCADLVEGLINPKKEPPPPPPPLPPPPQPESEDIVKPKNDSCQFSSDDKSAENGRRTPVKKTVPTETDMLPAERPSNYPSFVPNATGTGPIPPHMGIPRFPPPLMPSHMQYPNFSGPPPQMGGPWPPHSGNWDMSMQGGTMLGRPMQGGVMHGGQTMQGMSMQSVTMCGPPIHGSAMQGPPIQSGPMPGGPMSSGHIHGGPIACGPLVNRPALPSAPPSALMWRPPWPASPPFVSPPRAPPPEPAPFFQESNIPLDLDTRIELLLKGVNGAAPPFLTMDNDQIVNAGKEDKDSGNLSPPPLPPGEEPLPPRPPPSPSPATPPPQLEPDPDPEKYVPLSTPPSPFNSEEEYLESLLSWRLKQLDLVKRVEKEAHRKRKLLQSSDADKVSEVSSEEDEILFPPKAKPESDDDRMSLSSLSSANDKIEEVTVPPNPYGSFANYETAVIDKPQVVHYPPMQESEYNTYSISAHMSHVGPRMQPPYGWMNFQGPQPRFGMHGMPSYVMPAPEFPMRANGPRRMPYNQRPFMRPEPYFNHPRHRGPRPSHSRFKYEREAPQAVVTVKKDPLDTTVDLVLDEICKLMHQTLEKDLMKRFTEVLAFNELEIWWEKEEKKYKTEHEDAEKSKDDKKDDKDDKKATTESLLNSIIDSSYDGFTSSGFGLGLRASLPKMPSFKRKLADPCPPPANKVYQVKPEATNDSDQEEMVQVSDSEAAVEPDPAPVAPRKRSSRTRTTSSSYSISSDSAESSDSPDQSESEVDNESDTSISETEKLETAKNEFLDAIDDNALNRLREKTPEGRLTPIPCDALSDVDSEDLSKPPKTPDIHLSDSDGPPRTPSPSGPSGSRRRETAMEALMALGLDEFVCDIKFRDDPISSSPQSSKSRIRTPSPTVPFTPEPFEEPSFFVSKEDTKKKKKKLKSTSSTKRKHNASDERDTKTMSHSGNESDTSSSYVSSIAQEHSYSRHASTDDFLPWSTDHFDPSNDRCKQLYSDAKESTGRERKESSDKLVSHLLDTYLQKAERLQKKKYEQREPLQEMIVCYDFLSTGIDKEDIKYMKRAYDQLLADEEQLWLNEMHWVDHQTTALCRGTSRHEAGCARAQGYYKMDPREKRQHKHHYNKNKPVVFAIEGKASASREARSNQRRLLTAFGSDTDSDLLKFNQLKFRKKRLKFGKSEIHDWGLFAMEPIAADEMVIEYVGEMVRSLLADFREKVYEKQEIRSSYLFRIDHEAIVDATKCGNLARFINHSCDPNCYAKIITIEGEKKIVIYSKRDIKIDEEITYDYKFPLEEEKIVCLCGTPQCKGFLN